ncbi:MAG: hypothetical protein FJ147_26690 [Deltaproteobacteria bacterium]|nr:hypothetical protein [Deltaproteobacteria bacterium]
MKILIAYDGSACADAALHDLRRAGLPQEAETVILRNECPSSGWSGGSAAESRSSTTPPGLHGAPSELQGTIFPGNRLR